MKEQKAKLSYDLSDMVFQDIDTEAVTVTVEYETECVTQIVTVCDPVYGGYSKVHCKDVEQETCYNSPKLLEEVQPATVTVPEPERVCVDRPVKLTR